MWHPKYYRRDHPAPARLYQRHEGNPLPETKITVIYENPTDPATFEAAYESEQLEAARRIPGYLRLETSKVWPKEDGSPTPAYRMIDSADLSNWVCMLLATS